MNTAVAYTLDRATALLPATGLRVISCVGKAANDDGLTPHTLFDYDALNRVNTVTNGGGITAYDYDRSSLKTKVSYPNGTTAATTYDKARRVLTLDNRQGVAPVSSYAYLYDPNGNRTQQIEVNGGVAETTTYGFDSNDRLTQVTYPDKVTTYTFDGNANRLTEVTTVNNATTLNKTYAYNNRNQLTGVTDNLNAANSVTYTFDANGNQVSKTQGTAVTNFGYDVKDQLIGVKQNAANVGVFSYDYQGRRIVKDMGGAIVRYSYDGTSVLVETDNTGTTLAKFDYGPDRLLSMHHATEGRAYYLFDALGSVSNLMATTGAIQARYQYDAFGNYRAQAGSSFNRFGFTGHEKDNETNLYYFKARFYDPETGRFLNQDAYLGDINTPPSLHRYLYAYSNPTVWVDLTGYANVEAFTWKSEDDIPVGTNYFAVGHEGDKVYYSADKDYTDVGGDAYGRDMQTAMETSGVKTKEEKGMWDRFSDSAKSTWSKWFGDDPARAAKIKKITKDSPKVVVENQDNQTLTAEDLVAQAGYESRKTANAFEKTGEIGYEAGKEVSELCVPACGIGVEKAAVGKASAAVGGLLIIKAEKVGNVERAVVKQGEKELSGNAGKYYASSHIASASKIFEDVDKWSLTAVSDRQKKMILDKLQTVKQRSKEMGEAVRQGGFSEAQKNKIIRDWERENKIEWPEGATPHHVIPIKNGGAVDQWWNIIPVKNPHTGTIHGKGSALRNELPYEIKPGTVSDLK